MQRMILNKYTIFTIKNNYKNILVNWVGRVEDQDIMCLITAFNRRIYQCAQAYPEQLRPGAF